MKNRQSCMSSASRKRSAWRASNPIFPIKISRTMYATPAYSRWALRGDLGGDLGLRAKVVDQEELHRELAGVAARPFGETLLLACERGEPSLDVALVEPQVLDRLNFFFVRARPTPGRAGPPATAGCTGTRARASGRPQSDKTASHTTSAFLQTRTPRPRPTPPPAASLGAIRRQLRASAA
eukprot:SAG22_NODE_1_length_62449_cov_158.689270_46_plen_181_part_00